MKVVVTVLLATIALVALKISSSFHAQEVATAQLRQVYLSSVLKVLIMMSSLESLKLTVNSVLWEENVLKPLRIKVKLVKRVTSAHLDPILNSGPALQVLSVAIDQA